MIYLVLGILSSALISVLMRVSEKYRRNDLSMLAMNYLMCTVLAAVFTGGPVFPAAEGLPLTIGLGVISGVMFLGSFVLLQWNIRKNGVVLPATFMKLGVLVPTVLSILIFGETLRWTQIAGIAAAISAIFLMQGGGREKAASMVGLIALMLGGGSTDAMSKIYEEVASAALKDHYLMYTFFIAMLLCIVVCVLRRQTLTPMDALFGLAIGIPNYFSARFLLLSLAEIPAVVAYPSYNVGTIVLVTVLGMLVFKEKLGRRKLIALGIILAALALLNL